jgi:outer membrane receptor protein involved in Fe transport
MQPKPLPFLTLFFLFLQIATCFAQTSRIEGSVNEAATNQPLVGAGVSIKGTINGTFTDAEGNFSLKANGPFPLTLVITAVGFVKTEVAIQDAAAPVKVQLEPLTTLMQEVVVAASRVEESIMRSPVSIEKMDLRSIRQTASANFYDGLQNMKSVDMVTNGLNFKAINTRGFASTGNSRFLQLIDGVDNQPPGFNFGMGNVFGLSDLDVESVELIPGSASALYGPIAFNGVLMMRSKDPFQYQGLSVMSKVGVNHLNDPQTGVAPYYDVALRYAKSFNNRLAFKLNASYMKGLDWYATDYTDVDSKTPAAQRGPNNPAKNSLNVYGDEVAQTLPGIGRVARTGYEEKDLTDYHVYSLKLNGALHYRLTDNLEAIYQYNLGQATTNYTSSSRNSVNNFALHQHRLELRGNRFFVRAYTNIENSHNSYNTRSLGQWINKAWVRDLNGNVVEPDKANATWFTRYAAAYNGQVNGIDPQDHTLARTFADQGRLLPGTPEYAAQKDKYRNIFGGLYGAGVFSNSQLYHVEGQYDLSDQVKVVNLQVGGNYRVFSMFTNGTLFDDKDNKIAFHEYGIFAQASKEFFSQKLKLIASGRFDKNQNFQGRFTPRASAVYSPSDNHNFRASFQTGFRNPTPVDQYMKMFAGAITILGGTEANSRGMNVHENSYTAASVAAFSEAYGAAIKAGQTPQQAIEANKGKLLKSNVAYIKPEQITSYEVGYKGSLTKRLLADVNFYYSSYQDFISNQVVVRTPSPVLTESGQVNPEGAAEVLNGKSQTFQLYTNTSDQVSTQGISLGLTYYFPKGYVLSGNGTWADFNLRNANPNNIPAFNTPRYKSNLSLSNANVYRNLGFNVAWHWQDAFDWVGSFNELQPGRIQAYHLLDAQVSYKVPALKSIFKLGASNLTNQYIVQAYGSPAVGGLYYFSITFDELLR